MVTARFTLSRSEFYSCHRRVQARRFRHWAFIGISIVIALVGVADSVPGIIVVGVVYVLVYSAGIWLLAPTIIWRRTPQIRAEQAVSVSDTGIVTKWTNASTRGDWTFWRELRVIADIYVLPAKQRGHCLIPRRAFKSPQDEQRFLELVADHGL